MVRTMLDGAMPRPFQRQPGNSRVAWLLLDSEVIQRVEIAESPLMGTIVKGQSRAIFPVRFLRSFARQFIVAFPPSRSVFEKSQS
ncbi:MAG: hypothetical protein II863_16205, partial [Kiritimatiellae bacterium]|nr:hypothetical protein [Kiritimatiellia bacterium]